MVVVVVEIGLSARMYVAEQGLGGRKFIPPHLNITHPQF